MTKPKHPSMLKGKASKLTKEAVIRCRRMYAEGTQTVKEMAQFYGVGAETIRRALRGETWNDTAYDIPSEAELAEEGARSLERMQALIAAEKARKALGANVLEELEETPAPAVVVTNNPYNWLKK